jgi:hypothetical protein
LSHDPARSAEKSAVSIAGAIKKQLVQKSKKEMLTNAIIEVNTLDDMKVLLADTINQVRRGTMDPKFANCIGYLSDRLLPVLRDLKPPEDPNKQRGRMLIALVDGMTTEEALRVLNDPTRQFNRLLDGIQVPETEPTIDVGKLERTKQDLIQDIDTIDKMDYELATRTAPVDETVQQITDIALELLKREREHTTERINQSHAKPLPISPSHPPDLTGSPEIFSAPSTDQPDPRSTSIDHPAGSAQKDSER